MRRERSWSDRAVARREGPQTPLGHWLEKEIKSAGFPSKDAFRKAIDVTNSTFNDWQRADRASVPERAQVTKMVSVLRLNREKRAGLEDVLSEQEKARDEALRAPARADVTVRTPETTAERQIEIVTSYTHLPVALKLMAKIPRYEPILDALPLWRGKDEDPTIEGWFRIGDEMLSVLRSHSGEGIGDDDVGLGGGRLEALKKKGTRS